MAENRYRDRINNSGFCIGWAYLGHVPFMVVGDCHNRHGRSFQWFGRCWKIFLPGTKRPSLKLLSKKEMTRGNRLKPLIPPCHFLCNSREFQRFYAFCISHAIIVCLQSTDVVTEPTPAGTGEIRSTMGSTSA